MVDYNRSGDLRGGCNVWRGSSKDTPSAQRWKKHLRFKICITFISAILAAIAGYMVGDRQPPLMRYWGKIIPDDPPPGTHVYVNWDLQWFRRCPGKVYRRIVDSHRIVWEFEPFEAEYVQAKKISSIERKLERSFMLPGGIASGPAEYFAVVKLQCNAFHKWWPIVVDEPTILFTVGDREPEDHRQ